MYCRNCGKEIENNSSFCIHCGEKLGQAKIQGKETLVGNEMDDDEQKRLRYRKYASYMLLIALFCIFAIIVTQSDDYSPMRGYLSLLMFIFGGAGLIVYFTNR